MGCSTDTVFLREPVIANLKAMNNALLTLSINLWTDDTQKTPYSLSGYTGRGALKNKTTGVLFATPFTVVITQTSLITNVSGTISKAAIETISVDTPYIYDLSVDNTSTGDSMVIWTGLITFKQGASS